MAFNVQNDIISPVGKAIGKALKSDIGQYLGGDMLRSARVHAYRPGHESNYMGVAGDIANLMIGGNRGRANSWKENVPRAIARNAAFHGTIGVGYGLLSGQGALRHGFRGVMSPVRMPANAVLGTDW